MIQMKMTLAQSSGDYDQSSKISGSRENERSSNHDIVYHSCREKGNNARQCINVLQSTQTQEEIREVGNEKE